MQASPWLLLAYEGNLPITETGKALGGEPGTAHFIAWKPKGMWHRTYQRKRFEIEWCEDQANVAFIRKYSHLLAAGEFERFLGTGVK